MPPGLTANLHGITYCPEAAIAAAAQTPGAAEQADPSCPASLADRHHQRRRRSRLPSLPRGRQDLPRRALPGRAAVARRDHPGARRPLRLRHRRRPGRAPRRPARRPRHRRLRNRARDHRRHPDPDALDPGQHRQAELHDQPDQLRALLGRLAGDRRPGHGRRLLLLLPRGQLRDAAVQAEDDDHASSAAARRPQRSQDPSLHFDLQDPPGRRQHQVGRGDPAEGLRDRPAPPRQHLLESPAGSRTLRRAPADRHGRRPRRRCSNSRSRARPTRSPASASCRTSPSSSAAR